MSFGRPAARLDRTTSASDATGTFTPDTTTLTLPGTSASKPPGEPCRGEAQIGWTVGRHQRERRHLAELLGMRIERDPFRHALDPKAGIDRPQRFGETLQVLPHRRRADIDVHRRMTGVV